MDLFKFVVIKSNVGDIFCKHHSCDHFLHYDGLHCRSENNLLKYLRKGNKALTQANESKLDSQDFFGSN